MQPQIRKAFDAVLDKQTDLVDHAHAFLLRRLGESRGAPDGRALCTELQIPYFPIPLPAWNAETFLDEAIRAKPLFVAHRMGESDLWKGLCLHGVSSTHTLPSRRYGYSSEDDVPYQWTEASESCPRTTAWLKQLLERGYFEEFFRVRYMWLEPGGYIDFHRDRPEHEHLLGPLNLALNMPAGCHWLFREWGPVPFQPGRAIMVDVAYEHGVWNNSSEDRIHLIVHGRYGPKMFETLKESVTAERGRLAPLKNEQPSFWFFFGECSYLVLEEALRKNVDWMVFVAKNLPEIVAEVRALCLAAESTKAILEDSRFVAIRMYAWRRLQDPAKRLFSARLLSITRFG